MKPNQNSRRSRSRGPAKSRKPGGSTGNRMDNRSRGNPKQSLEKYKNLAIDAHRSGDRILAENYNQYADHYQRQLNEREAAQPQRNERDQGRQQRQNHSRHDNQADDQADDQADNQADSQADNQEEDAAPAPKADAAEKLTATADGIAALDPFGEAPQPAPADDAFEAQPEAQADAQPGPEKKPRSRRRSKPEPAPEPEEAAESA